MVYVGAGSLVIWPRKSRGIESQGMILMTENEKGELGFVCAEDWENGYVIS